MIKANIEALFNSSKVLKLYVNLKHSEGKTLYYMINVGSVFLMYTENIDLLMFLTQREGYKHFPPMAAW